METLEFKVSISPTIGEVSCLVNHSEEAKAMIILAHGAGAGMRHPFMNKLSDALTSHHISTLRYQFPYMEQGKKRPDKPETAHKTTKEVHLIAKQKFSNLSFFLGGKSFGGRMSSQAVANGSAEEVSGIIFYGFPLHPPGKVSIERSEHLFKVEVPMLFCQGSKDKLADIQLMKELDEKLGQRSEMYIIEEADHSFQLPKSLNISHDQVIRGLATKTAKWIDIIKLTIEP